MNDALVVQIYKDSKTIKLVDEFERQDKAGKKLYTELVLSDVFCVKYKHKLYWVSLVLKRMPKDLKCLPSGLNFTDFKNMFCEKVFTLTNPGTNILSKSCIEGIRKTFSSESHALMYMFPIPIHFRAQNSGNRSGYGNRYYREELVWEGTLYGETTDYMFTEVRYKRWQ